MALRPFSVCSVVKLPSPYGKLAVTSFWIGEALTTQVGLDPVHAPDQEKPEGSVPDEDVAVSVTAVGFVV